MHLGNFLHISPQLSHHQPRTLGEGMEFCCKYPNTVLEVTNTDLSHFQKENRQKFASKEHQGRNI